MAPNHLMSGSLTKPVTFKKLLSIYLSMHSSTFCTVLARHTAFKTRYVVMILQFYLITQRVYQAMFDACTDVSLLRATWRGLHSFD